MSDRQEHPEKTVGLGKVQFVLSFISGDTTIVEVDPHWLHEMLLEGRWFSVGVGEDERMFNVATIETVHRHKEAAR